MKTAWIFGLVLAGLSACGPLHEQNPFGRVIPGVGGQAAVESTTSEASGPLTRAQIEAQPVDLLRVSIISREVTALLVKGGENGGKVTWLSAEGPGLTFKNGLLVGSRGFGDDLMGADVSAAIRSLRGGGNHIRTLDFLNGLDQIERRRFQCSTARTGSEVITIFERAYATTIIEETCTSDRGSFKNTYWQDANGVIWQSRQWISDGVGYLGYQRL